MIKSKQNKLQETLLNGKDIKSEFNTLFDSIKTFIRTNKNKFEIGYKEENKDFILNVVENKTKSKSNININLFDFQQVLSSEDITDANNFTIYEKQWINTLRKAVDKKLEDDFKLNIVMGTFRKDDLRGFINSIRFAKLSGIDIKKVSKIYVVDLYKIRENDLDYTEL